MKDTGGKMYLIQNLSGVARLKAPNTIHLAPPVAIPKPPQPEAIHIVERTERIN